MKIINNYKKIARGWRLDKMVKLLENIALISLVAGVMLSGSLFGVMSLQSQEKQSIRDYNYAETSCPDTMQLGEKWEEGGMRWQCVALYRL